MRATASAATKAAAQKIKLHHYASLLVAELAFILIYPFFHTAAFGNSLFRLLGVIVFTASIYPVLGRGRITLIAWLLGVPAILISSINLTGHLLYLHTLALGLGAVFLAFMTSFFLWTIVSDPSVTADTLAGAVSAFLLIGITFGIIYTLIEQLVPGSFRDTVEPAKQLTQSELTFFSFMTLTTVGYGDVVPWQPHARAFTILESVIGIMYPAVLVARLVGLHGHKREQQ